MNDYKEEVLRVESLFRTVGRTELLPRLNRVAAASKVVEGDLAENVTEADLAASARILRDLRQRFPGSYSEEEISPDRFSHAILWQVDPLDGTDEFCAGRRNHFAVQAGLLREVEGAFEAVAGVIHLPGTEESFFGWGDGVWMERGSASGAVQLSRPHERASHETLRCFVRAVDGMPFGEGRQYYERLARSLDRPIELIETGGAGAAFGALLKGEIDIVLLNVDYTKEWDASMADPLVRSLGGWLVGLDGRPLAYNKKGTNYNAGGVISSLSVPMDTALGQVRKETLIRRRTL